MKIIRNSALVLSLFTIFALTTASSGFAAEGESAGLGSLIEEITVTARKREETLLDAPLSVTAFSGESLEVRGIDNISGIGDITPNMTYQNNPQAGGSSSVATVYVRGVGQRDFLGTIDNGVGFYIDGVYIARTVGATIDLVVVDREEVLRGPLGNLFGRNSVGRAVSLCSKAAAEEFGGHVELGVGTDSQLIVGGSIDVPFSENFSIKFSSQSNTRDG